ncbi:MAG: hypothetical protein ACYCSN_13475 [Acidobacteriaceae bacterium]
MLAFGERAGSVLCLTTEDEEIFYAHSVDECASILETNNLQLFLRDWSDWPFKLAANWSYLYAKRDARVVITYTSPYGHHKTYKICLLKHWGLGEKGLKSLALLRRVFDGLEVGAFSTPGAIGEALMHRLLKKSQSTVSKGAQRFLLDHFVGGLMATPGVGFEGEEAFELDQRRSYPTAAKMALPVGAARYIAPGTRPDPEVWLERWPWFFARIAFYIPPEVSDRLTHGIIGYRIPNGKMVYPTRPGMYGMGEVDREMVEDVDSRIVEYIDRNKLVLTEKGFQPKTERYLVEEPTIKERFHYENEVYADSGTIRLALEAGYRIIMRTGYVWFAVDDVLARWSDYLAEKEAELGPELRGIVKKIGVAGIGRLLCRPVRMTGVPLAMAPPKSRVDAYSDDDIAFVEEADPNAVPMPHWGIAIISQVRVSLLRRWSAEEDDGNRVLAAYVDALTLERPSRLPLDGWKLEQLIDVKIPADRELISRNKVRLPSLSGEERRKVLKHAKV